MCTAITYQGKCHYFGRNLDLEYHYKESVTITPRNYILPFRCLASLSYHHAMIGMATVVNDYPLYYEATNECGLSMAGLNFPGNAVYLPQSNEMNNITPFELIPYILSTCSNVDQAEECLKQVRIADIPFSEQYPLTPLHWLLSDKTRSITIEPLADGTRIYANDIGILTNNPPFEYHMHNIANYLNLTSEEATNRFAPEYAITPYSRGMGAIGLPGDLSSASRFVRAAFTKLNSVSFDTELMSVGQFFHILGSVEQQAGCVKVGNRFEKTVYSSCCNTEECIYYYKTYENSQITGIALKNADLDGAQLTCYPLITEQQIRMENQ